MKGFFLSFLLLTTAYTARAETFNIDGKSVIGLETTELENLVTQARFDKFTGSFSINPLDAEKSHIGLTIDACSFNSKTGNKITANLDPKLRDEHVSQKSEFLDCKKFPTITFASTKVSARSPGIFNVEGTLTIKGVPKPIYFAVKKKSEEVDPSTGQKRVKFETVEPITINYKDFNMEGGFLAIGMNLRDSVKLKFDVVGEEINTLGGNPSPNGQLVMSR